MKRSWSRTASKNGSEVIHATIAHGRDLRLCNFPGTRTMFGEIRFKGALVITTNFDKCDTAVKEAKERLIERAREMALE